MKLQIFRTISVGGVAKPELRARLEAAGVQFNAYAETLFDEPSFAPEAPTETFELVKISADELGMPNSFSYQGLLARARERGLTTCPLALAAFLRLAYLEQPEGAHLTIASIKPSARDDAPNGFYIRNTAGHLWLRGYRADDVCDWPPGNEFIFRKV